MLLRVQWTLIADSAVSFCDPRDSMPGRWQLFIVLLSIAWQLILIAEYFTDKEANGRFSDGQLMF